MTNQLITYRLPIDYSLISLMSLMSSISYAWLLSGRLLQCETLFCKQNLLFITKRICAVTFRFTYEQY